MDGVGASVTLRIVSLLLESFLEAGCFLDVDPGPNVLAVIMEDLLLSKTYFGALGRSKLF